MNLNYERIGKRIREKRIALRLSQADLAELADTSPQYISHIETGKKKVSLGVLYNIASALSTSMDYLITGNTENVSNDPYGPLIGMTAYEKRIMADIITATRRTLDENRWRFDE